jgi:polar amino acid transport system substrate-binding protein
VNSRLLGHRRRTVLVVSLGLASGALALSACSAESGALATASDSKEASSLAASASAATATAGSSSAAASSSELQCTPDTITTKVEHLLTIGTDKPAFPPYFVDNNPKNGKGFESAVAYAVAKQLGFDAAHVKWITVPFDSSYQPGRKAFDFDINQISVTTARAKVVDFSAGYYNVNQAVVALKGSKADGVTTIAGLKKLKFGVQVGTTSLQTLKDTVKPIKQPSVYNDTTAATQALKNKQVDAIVVDLPTAYFISAAQLDNGVITGQFEAPTSGEHFGLLMEKGSTALPCVNKAIASITDSGELQKITDRWLGAGAGVATFK